jgi:hypothetical protein
MTQVLALVVQQRERFVVEFLLQPQGSSVNHDVHSLVAPTNAKAD